MNHLITRVQKPDATSWIYTGLLMTGLLVAPVQAQTAESETVPDSEATSAKIANLGGEESPVLKGSTFLHNAQPISAIGYPDTDPVIPNSVNPETELSSEIDSADRLDSNKLPTINNVETLHTASLPNQSELVRSPDNLANSEPGSDTTIKEKITSVSVLAQAVSPNSDLGSFELDEPETDPMEQVTNVSQLRDVSPGDWAYEALRNLVERYGCIAGYPDGTFRGNRAMTRYEFAAGLNSCLQQVERLMTGVKSGVPNGDLETLQRLTQEFKPELATLVARVDNLEGRTAFLEDHQFSPTTKLFGQVVIGVQGRTENTADFFPVDGKRDREDSSTNINIITNTQLSLFTQFTPHSLLLTGLQAGEGSTGNPVLTNDVRLGYEGDTNNSLKISDLTYRQLIGNKFAFIVGPVGVNAVNVFRGANRVESVGFGPLSRFAQRNPIINIGAGRGGVGFDWQINSRISLQGIYSASLPDNPKSGGIFGGDLGETALGAQVTLAPTKTVDVALSYINAYSPFGRLGTGVGDDQLTVNSALKTNAFGATLAWRVSPRFTIGTWGGYTNSWIPDKSGNVETTNWMVFLNFPDLFGKGNLGGIYIGQPPKIVSSDLPVGKNIPNSFAGGLGSEGDQPGTTTHVEAFFRYRLSDHITITPGVIVIFEPAHTPASDTIVIGALRTTFTF